MTTLDRLESALNEHLSAQIDQTLRAHDELTIEVPALHILQVIRTLRDQMGFEQLTDLFGVDYSAYGDAEWQTSTATGTGFSRGAIREDLVNPPPSKRFAVVYQLLSLQHNVRVRVRVFLNADDPRVPTVTDIYNVADWLEREAFDMYGILFDDHPDLRRILTDYGFVGYPFRKDFPVSGHVEMRYDESEKRIVYEPVEIEPRTLVARVIRDDNRYGPEEQEHV